MTKIKLARKKLGMTVRTLSEKSKVAVGYISDIENDVEGKTNPTKNVMERIAAALDCSVAELFF